jgi:hypothetical protein
MRVLVFFSVAAVAQWIEYRPPKPRVVGSIPASRTSPCVADKQGLKRKLKIHFANSHFWQLAHIGPLLITDQMKFLWPTCGLLMARLQSHPDRLPVFSSIGLVAHHRLAVRLGNLKAKMHQLFLDIAPCHRPIALRQFSTDRRNRFT